MSDELTVAVLLKVRVRHLLFAALGKENGGSLGVSQQGLVVLDPRSRSPLARTLLHELIHVKRPMWSETRTLQEENRLWHLATWKEKGELYRLLGKAKVWDGQQDFDVDEDVVSHTQVVEPPKPTPQQPLFEGVEPKPLPPSATLADKKGKS